MSPGESKRVWALSSGMGVIRTPHEVAAALFVCIDTLEMRKRLLGGFTIDPNEMDCHHACMQMQQVHTVAHAAPFIIHTHVYMHSRATK